MYCLYCGVEVGEGQKYCPSCGKCLEPDTKKETLNDNVQKRINQEAIFPKIAFISGGIFLVVIISIVLMRITAPENRLIGRWENVGGNESTMEFLQDGTCIGYDLNDNPIGFGTWSLYEDSLTITPEESMDSYTYDAQVNYNTLILGAWTETDYEEVQYVKVE